MRRGSRTRPLTKIATRLRGGATFTASSVSGKVTGYNPASLHKWGFLTVFGPSCFSSPFLWVQTCGVLGLAGLSCWATLATQLSKEVALVSLSEGLEDALHALIIFLLGLFLSEVVSRWWALNFDCLGGLADAVDGTALLAASLLPNDTAAQATLVRWGRLSFSLLFEQAQGIPAVEGARRAVAKGLATPDEAAALVAAVAASGSYSIASSPVDARQPWVWCARLWAAQGTLEGPAAALAQAQCLKGVGKVGDALCLVDTKLPLPYVHLLTAMAKFQMVFMALTRGAAIAGHLAADGHLGSVSGIMESALDVIRLVIVPVLYQGCFDMHTIMANPFGCDTIDIPQEEAEQSLQVEASQIAAAGAYAPLKSAAVPQ